MSWRNKWVLRCFLKVPKVSQFLSSCGKLFHTRGVATENQTAKHSFTTRYSQQVLSRWTEQARSWYECSVSERYCSWFSVRHRKHNVDSFNWILECARVLPMQVIKLLWRRYYLGTNESANICAPSTLEFFYDSALYKATYGCEGWTLKEGRERCYTLYPLYLKQNPSQSPPFGWGTERGYVSIHGEWENRWVGSWRGWNGGTGMVRGAVPGASRRGPLTAWMDHIKTWTGLSVEESFRTKEDRDKWRKYVHGVAKPRIKDG